MKLASLKSKNSLDGELVVVSHDAKCFVRAHSVAPSLRQALENWSKNEPSLQKIYSDLNENKIKGEPMTGEEIFHSALPRTWLFADGSAFIHHIRLVRKARKAAVPETLLTVPLMYQAESGRFLAPTEDIPQRDFVQGTDFEAEVGVIVDHVPAGVSGLIPDELAQGFGFFQSKPNKTLSPLALTPNELGKAWAHGRLHLPLNVKYNGQFFGKANAGEMHFHFGELIAYAAKTRDLAAGTLIGSGTVSNEDASVGSSCLVEKRTLEQIETGAPITSYMKVGDTVEISMCSEKGEDLFGRIHQKVTPVS
jgi:fumarylacetoacetate (FAA) hydrolase